MRPYWRTVFVLSCFGVLAVATMMVPAQTPPNAEIPRVPNPPLAADLTSLPGDLRAIAFPAVPNISDFVKDQTVARALGKALFWDMQVGSDGVQACASCHFRAGADPRSKNQLSPGLKQTPHEDLNFFPGGSYQPTGTVRRAPVQRPHTRTGRTYPLLELP